ncbi:MAG: AAA family ATPase [Bacteroidetes bacterium RIFCSPLOWO2_12_FULL_31_6]|nr:MAG: AAA family ATPase [Bacteroidetes bacterium RIFCSPLOWO2_12_FULL_31_6]
MEKLISKSITKINRVTTTFERYLINQINLKNRLIVILGARGVGKTTLLLQLAKKMNQEVLYVALDDLFFSDNTLYSLAEEFQKIGGRALLLDEVHKYPNWSREIKLIYDDFNELQIIFTSSSILDIYKGESDLSRRAISYHLKSLSFREYLLFYEKIELPTFTLKQIMEEHTQITLNLTQQIKPFKYLKTFIETGAYPYYNNNPSEYYQQILNTINLILDVDIQSITSLNYDTISKLKRLLYVIATNVPFTPNISKLSERIGVHRNVLVQALQLLDRAELIHSLYNQNISISSLTKPNKIWLRNTNLNYAISSENVNVGNIRETFFIQHLNGLHQLSLPENGDFLVDDTYTFEVGGKNKSQKQITGINNAFLVKDDLEISVMNHIPLWLFGLIY